MKKKFSKILGVGLTLALLLSLLLIAAPVAATDVGTVGFEAGMYDRTLNLENKVVSSTAPWEVLDQDTFGGVLGYNISGPTFVWGLEATVPGSGTYALIYYADFSVRFDNWGGDNPGAVIANNITSTNGVISVSGTIDLNMDLPSPLDANQFEINYAGEYDTEHGAKIWLVPVEVLTNSVSLPIISWTPDNNWLFETDLIWYDDTDSAALGNIVSITVTPADIDFGILSPLEVGEASVTVAVGNIPTVVSASGAGLVGTVFSGMTLDGITPANFDLLLGAGESSSVALAFTAGFPENYGLQSGTLLFIATGVPTHTTH